MWQYPPFTFGRDTILPYLWDEKGEDDPVESEIQLKTEGLFPPFLLATKKMGCVPIFAILEI